MRCYFCGKEIDKKKDKYTLIGTYNRISKPQEEVFFHFQCYVEWFNRKVLEKATVTMKVMQQKALGVFNNPMIKGLLEKVGGMETLGKMLNYPLDKKKIILINPDLVKEKIKDGRKRKTTKKRSKK